MSHFQEALRSKLMLKYPPFYYLCYIKISGKDMSYISKEADKIRRALDRNLENSNILGPTPSTIFRINNIYRYGIILKYKKDHKLRYTLEKILEHYKGNQKVKIDIDFNPSQIY